MKPLKTTLVYLVRLFIRLRYKVTIRHDNAGWDQNKGTLFLCTHAAAFIETALVRYSVWHTHQPKHIASELLTHNSSFASLAYRMFDEFLGSSYIPYFRNTTNSIKIGRLNGLVDKVSEDLAQGKSYFAFPSGLNRETSYEDLGANSLIHRVLQSNPDINIAYVRSTGFWGSVFSNTVAENNLENNFAFMVRMLVSNFGFHTKKAASIDIKYEQQDLGRLDREALNRHVEEILNECYPKTDSGRREEPVNWVSYSRSSNQFLKKKVRIANEETSGVDTFNSPNHQKIREKIGQLTSIPSESISPDAIIAEELGIDSIDIFELIIFLQSQFKVEIESVEKLHRVRDVYAAIENYHESAPEAELFETSGDVNLPDASSLPEMFIRHVEANHLGQIQDSQLGMIDYRALQKQVELIYLAVRNYEGEKIGVLLPQSIQFYSCLLALQMAGKTPVILNYRNRSLLGDDLQSLGVSKVLTSAVFIETQQAVDFGSDLDDKIIYLEEALFSRILWHWLCRFNRFLFNYTRAKPDDTAMILFTSGSESKAKAVPLTHRNILTTLKARYEFMQLTNDDVFLSILPSYHSMGVVACGFLPLLTGVNVHFVSSPANIGETGMLLKRLNPTILIVTPTILRPLIDGYAKSLHRLRIINTGSEAVSHELLTLARNNNVQGNWMHGYGTTETASTLTLNPDFGKNLSVGSALSHIRIRIVDPNDYTIQRAPEKQGLILIQSNATFSGYLGDAQQDKLIQLDGGVWLNTGDIGYLDNSGSLFLTDRLSRTIKIGGEMISLTTVEEALSEHFASGDASCEFVLTTRLDDPSLVLHTTMKIDHDDLANFLRQRFRNMIRISTINNLPEIPRNDTGKILFGLLDGQPQLEHEKEVIS